MPLEGIGPRTAGWLCALQHGAAATVLGVMLGSEPVLFERCRDMANDRKPTEPADTQSLTPSATRQLRFRPLRSSWMQSELRKNLPNSIVEG
jgi:hypothetical protein